MNEKAKIDSDLPQVWQKFVSTWLEQPNQSAEPDENWPSPCEYEEQGEFYWRPVLQQEQGDKLSFDNVEEALGIKIHEDYQILFYSVLQ